MSNPSTAILPDGLYHIHTAENPPQAVAFSNTGSLSLVPPASDDPEQTWTASQAELNMVSSMLYTSCINTVAGTCISPFIVAVRFALLPSAPQPSSLVVNFAQDSTTGNIFSFNNDGLRDYWTVNQGQLGFGETGSPPQQWVFVPFTDGS